MKIGEVVSKVKSLNLPKGSYIVYGSGPLAAVGIREANDIDMLVSSHLYKQLKESGWKKRLQGPKDEPLVFDVFEAHENWDFSEYSPTLEDLLSRSFEVDGVPFASIKDVRKWKSTHSHPKASQDLALMDAYLI